MLDLICHKNANSNFDEMLSLTGLILFSKHSLVQQKSTCQQYQVLLKVWNKRALLYGKWAFKTTHSHYKWHTPYKWHMSQYTMALPSKAEKAYSLQCRNLFLRMYSRERLANLHPESCKCLFIAAALFVMVKFWKQPTHLSIIEQKN